MIKILAKLGFEERKAKGSQRFFMHPKTKLTTVVPDHGTEDISIRLLRSILRDLDIDPKEFDNVRNNI